MSVGPEDPKVPFREESMKRISRLAVSAALSVGMIVGSGGVALASGHGNQNGKGASHKPSPTTLTGTVACNMHGVIVIGTNGYVRIHALLTPKKGAKGAACTLSGGMTGETAPRTGVLNISAGSRTAPTTTVSEPSSTTTPACPPMPSTTQAMSGGTVMWLPRAKVAPTNFSLSTGTIASSNEHLLLTFSAGTTSATGAFASTSVSLSLTSRALATALAQRCVHEFWVIPFTGTVSL